MDGERGSDPSRPFRPGSDGEDLIQDYEWLEKCVEIASHAESILALMNGVRSLFQERFSFDRFGILVGTINNRYCIVHEIVTGEGLKAAPPGALMIVKSTGLERVFESRKPHYNPDIAVTPEFMEDPELEKSGIRSIVRTPLMFRDEVFGVMTVKSHAPDQYSPRDLRLIERIAKRFSAIIYSLQLIYTLREVSYRDALTGAFNRRLLTAIEERSPVFSQLTGLELEDDCEVVVLFLDIDRLKQWNDRHGHVAGDKLLAETAERLRHLVADDGLVIRYGGDEFLVVIPDIPFDKALEWERRLRAHVRNRTSTPQTVTGPNPASPFHKPHPAATPEGVADEDWSISASIGSAHGKWGELSVLVHKADLQMYREKSDSSRNGEATSE